MDGFLDDRGMPRLAIRFVGATASLTAVIDTGFEGDLLAYMDQLDAIGLRPPYRDIARFRLADGNEATFFVAALRIIWHDAQRDIDLDVVPATAPQGVTALIGCGLLRDSRLDIDFPRGAVLVSRA